MKHFIYICILATMGMVACSNSNNADRHVKELRGYVDSVKRDNLNVDYNDDSYWERVEAGYEEKKKHVEADVAHMDNKLKQEYEELKNEYETLKMKYAEEREKVRGIGARRLTLRNTLFGEGVIGEDMTFSFMTAKNALTTYQHFVDVVEMNKDKYSREDWDEIKVLYEAMDTRKNAIEKDLSTKDNMKIATQKIRFSAIKAVNRPMSKAEENADAKK